MSIVGNEAEIQKVLEATKERMRELIKKRVQQSRHDMILNMPIDYNSMYAEVVVPAVPELCTIADAKQLVGRMMRLFDAYVEAVVSQDQQMLSSLAEQIKEQYA